MEYKKIGNIYAADFMRRSQKSTKTLKIIAYDPDNISQSDEYQHVWRYGQTVYVTELRQRPKPQSQIQIEPKLQPQSPPQPEPQIQPQSQLQVQTKMEQQEQPQPQPQPETQLDTQPGPQT